MTVARWGKSVPSSIINCEGVVMKKLFAIVVLGLISFSVQAAQPKKVVVPTASPDWVKLEAMWAAGGPKYQVAINKLASRYYTKMDASCHIRLPHAFDVTEAVKAYKVVFTPRGAEKVRDSSIRKQVAALACATRYDNGAERAASLSM